MEVENSPAPTMMSPASLNPAQLVRVQCSQRNCKTIILKGDLCEQCTIASTRSRRPFPDASNYSMEGIVGGSISTASDGKTYPEALMVAMKTQRVTSVSHMSKPPSYVQHNTSTVSDIQRGQHSRPSVAVPYTNNHTLRVPTSVMSRTPLVNHFNSLGEVIQDIHPQQGRQASARGGHDLTPTKPRLCVRCLHAVPSHYIGNLCPGCRVEVAKIPVQTSSYTKGVIPVNTTTVPRPVENKRSPNETSTDVTKEVLSIIADVENSGLDDDGDIDMEDMELSYPTASDCAPIPPPRAAKRSSVSILKLDSSRSRSDTPKKRQKVVVQPVFIDVKVSPPPTPSGHILPSQAIAKSAKLTKVPPRSLKLCTTNACTGIIPVNSFAMRCLTCVRRDWKSKRSAISTNEIGKGSSERNSTGILKPSQTPKKVVKKKGVTWADGIIATPTQKTECQTLAGEATTVAEETVSTTEPIKISDETPFIQVESKEETIALEDYMNLEGLLEAGSDGQEHRLRVKDLECTLEPPSAILNDTPKNTLVATTVDPGQGSCMKVDAISAPSEGVSTNQASSSQKNYASTSEGPLSTTPDRVSGWYSDLSELSSSLSEQTDSGSSLESDSEEPPPTSTPSGFKIRIPARPAGIYAKKCAVPKCNQLLATSYRWKSCVMCRARSREYQRKRQNLQGRHAQLDEELKQIRDLGTPLAGYLCKETPKDEEDITLVPGARLCSIRNCTYIIPPVNEYRWKVCALCRLLKKERRDQEKLKDNPPVEQSRSSSSKKWVADTSSIMRSLDYLYRASPVIGSGRCRSLDCGMLVENSSSSDCRQCVARRLWLLHGGDNSANQQGPSTQSVEKPLGPTPYPRYKCFSACLSQFKERLAGFLQAQSIFFLFKRPCTGNALFSFDGEYSVVALDFDVVKRKEEVDASVLQLKREIEYVGRIKFSPKRLLSILDDGGIAIRFSCLHPVPILQQRNDEGETSVDIFGKTMQCEMEIAVLPDHSHRFIPGQRTIIRFRLFG